MFVTRFSDHAKFTFKLTIAPDSGLGSFFVLISEWGKGVILF